MKHYLLFLLMVFPMVSHAQRLEKGYHGFADAGYIYFTESVDPATIEISTTHGYQFNPFIFLGAGTGFDFSGKYKKGDVSGYPFKKRESKVDIPVFFNFRANLTKTKLSPFVDIRFGAYVNSNSEEYSMLNVGARYGINETIGLFFSVGYMNRKITVEELNMTIGDKYNGYRTDYYYNDHKESTGGFIFKIGVDF